MSTSAPNTTILHPSTTIDDIPPEILSRICYFNTYRDWSSLHENDTSPKCILWPAISDTVRASHVCRRWRDILISSPDLWVNIDLKKPEFTCVMLERSRACGIKTVVAPTTPQSETVVSCQEIRSRLVECHLTEAYQFSPVWENTVPTFPRLRFLYLNNWKLPGNFPGLATPALESLYLQKAFTHDFHRFDVFSGTLTHLAIVSPRQRMEPRQLILLINRLPNLESLTLCHALCHPPIATVPMALKQLRVLNFSLREDLDMGSQFFHHAELTQSLQNISLGIYGRNRPQEEHVVTKAMDAFNTVCCPGAFERCKLYIGWRLGEIAYMGLPNSKPSSCQPEQHKFQVHFSSSFMYWRFLTLLPPWSYGRVEHLTIHLPVFNPFYGDLGEEVLIEMFRCLSNVRVLDGVGSTLWSLLYRWSHPHGNDERPVLPLLREIVLHHDCVLGMLETDEDCPWAPVTDSDEDEDDTEEEQGSIATAALVTKIFPESDSEDGSFVYQSGRSDSSDFEDSTEFIDMPEFLELMRGKRGDEPDCCDEFIDSQEIVEFCSNRALIRNFIISHQMAQDDKRCSDLRLALGELGVLLETRSGPTK